MKRAIVKSMAEIAALPIHNFYHLFI